MAGQQHERNLAGLGRDRVSLVPGQAALVPDTPVPLSPSAAPDFLVTPDSSPPPAPMVPERLRRSRSASVQPPDPIAPESVSSSIPDPEAEEPVLNELPSSADVLAEDVPPDVPVVEPSAEPFADESLSGQDKAIPDHDPPAPKPAESPDPTDPPSEEQPTIDDPADSLPQDPVTPDPGEDDSSFDPVEQPLHEESFVSAEPESYVPEEVPEPPVLEPIRQDADYAEPPTPIQPDPERIDDVPEPPTPVEPDSRQADNPPEPTPQPLQSPQFVPLQPEPAEPAPFIPLPQQPDEEPPPVPQEPIFSAVPQAEEADLPLEQGEDQRWSMEACWRLVSSDRNALNLSHGFRGEYLTVGSDGLYALHKEVGSSLQTHLRAVQKKEWDGVTIPSLTSASRTEKTQAKRWERAKQHFADVIGRNIVSDPPSGKKLQKGEISETFAYKLYYWMQECMRSLDTVYREREGETARIHAALSLIGFTGLSAGAGQEMKKRQYEDTLMRGLWHVYQDLHMKGKNSSIAFIRQVAIGIKARHGGVMDEDELYYAMNIFRRLPFFGKEGELMNAIELATIAVSRPEGSYAHGFYIPSLNPSSREGKTIAFIQKKIPLTSERRVYPASSQRRGFVQRDGALGGQEEDDEEESSP